MSSRRNRGRGGGGGHGDGGEERWLLPYSDMITLLLGLFIVLFAMSSIDAKQFDNVRRSLSQTFNGQVLEEPGSVLPGSNDVLDPSNPSDAPTTEAIEIENATRMTAQRFEQETRRLDQLAKQLNLGNDVQVTRNERGIVVRLAGDALFESGKWDIKPGVTAQLTKIERELQAFNHPIEIAGHTDGAPYDGQWGNYGLGNNRALAVHALFRDLGYPEARMQATTYGATRPVKQPPTPTTPMRENRRIEITVLEPGADDGFANLSAKEQQLAVRSPRTARSSTPTPAERVDAELQREFAGGDIVEELAGTSRAVG